MRPAPLVVCGAQAVDAPRGEGGARDLRGTDGGARVVRHPRKMSDRRILNETKKGRKTGREIIVPETETEGRTDGRTDALVF